MTNSEKHDFGVSLVSNHLNVLDIEHEIVGSEFSHDINILNSEERIKIFSNFGRNKSIKVNRDFEVEEGVLYLVVSPSDRNNIGYTCVGGYGDVVKDSVKSFVTSGSPRNIELNKLGFVNLRKRFSGD